jgi:hypothetical protein
LPVAAVSVEVFFVRKVAMVSASHRALRQQARANNQTKAQKDMGIASGKTEDLPERKRERADSEPGVIERKRAKMPAQVAGDSKSHLDDGPEGDVFLISHQAPGSSSPSGTSKDLQAEEQGAGSESASAASGSGTPAFVAKGISSKPSEALDEEARATPPVDLLAASATPRMSDYDEMLKVVEVGLCLSNLQKDIEKKKAAHESKMKDRISELKHAEEQLRQMQEGTEGISEATIDKEIKEFEHGINLSRALSSLKGEIEEKRRTLEESKAHCDQLRRIEALAQEGRFEEVLNRVKNYKSVVVSKLKNLLQKIEASDSESD